MIKTRWLGGPLDGSLVEVPALEDCLTVDPTGAASRRSTLPGMRQRHRYELACRITQDGIPIYRYVGVEK